jgi:probable pyridine nucleotide-disulfide oxidoreductase
MEQYAAIIIGGGKGGKTLATYLGKKGLKVALIERRSARIGGTCIK